METKCVGNAAGAAETVKAAAAQRWTEGCSKTFAGKLFVQWSYCRRGKRRTRNRPRGMRRKTGGQGGGGDE